MAHAKQAKKRIRQTERAEARNRPVRTFTARRVRDARAAIATGSPEAARSLRLAQSALDRAAKAGVLHRNAASRRKSRLAQALKRAGAAR
ncbi:MAG: 30S ribosomal protein S20 [Chloroflexi bacterium]|nr:30S ribosomal protein S20 [Chloroflexota bacterium]